MDVVDLKEFYASGLGPVARRLIARRMRARWTSLRGCRVAGLGYATPYLGAWRAEAVSLQALMPARQGVIHWPDGARSAAALVNEANLPLADSSVDRLLVIHGLEHWDAIDATLDEIWRVLAPDGRLLLVVPNRRGMWARAESTPFGHGRPFSRMQLIKLLREANFTPSGWSSALFVPPIERAFLRRSAAAWERVGIWLWPAFAGVIIVEATKQVFAVSGTRRARAPGRFRPELGPVPVSPRALSRRAR